MERALRRVTRIAVYWSIATVVVVILIVSIFLLVQIVHDRWIPIHFVLAPMFALIGLVLVLAGLRSPSTLGTRLLRRPGRPNISVQSGPVVLIGLGVLGGGLLYGLTGNADALVYSLAGSVGVIVLVSIIVGLRSRS